MLQWTEWSEVTQSCPTLCNLMDCSLSGSSIRGIFQARVLEWIAIVLRFKILPFVEVMKRLSNILNVLVFYLTPLYLRISWNWFFGMTWSGGHGFYLFVFLYEHPVVQTLNGKDWPFPAAPVSPLLYTFFSGSILLFIHLSIFLPILHTLNYFLKYYKAK